MRYMELLVSKKKRRAYKKMPWILFLLTVVILPAIAWPLSFRLTSEAQTYPLIVKILMTAVIIVPIVIQIPCICICGGYLLYCYGRSETQTLNVYDDVFVFSYYSGSSDNCTTDTYYIKNVASYTIKKRSITIKGEFKRKQSGRNSSQRIAHWITIPRTFENEEVLIDFFDKHILPEKNNRK